MRFTGLKWLLIFLLARHTETDTDPKTMENIEAEIVVICPKELVSAEVGGTATLEWCLESLRSAELMNITCNRSNTILHQYRGKRDDNSTQDPHNQGRTTFIKDNIRRGIVKLQIHNITNKDEGNYTCMFNSKSFFSKASMQLKVTENLQEDRKNETPKGKTEETDHSCSNVWYICIPTSVISMSLIILIAYFIWTKMCKQEARGGAEVKELLPLTDADAVNQNCQNERESLVQKAGPENQAYQNGRESLVQKDGPAPYTEAIVTLEENSASSHLDIRSDQKSVKLKGDAMPDATVKRGQPVAFGKDGFTEGKHFWKVHVGKAIWWAVGVVEEYVKRAVNSSNLLEEEGVRAVGLTAGQYQAFTSPLTNLSPDPPPETLVVYLDIGGGQLSFHNADTQKHIFTHMICVREKIFPFIWTMDQKNWITVSPPWAADTSDRHSEPF